MSTQKLKVLKKMKGIDSYSKNPIIDSLIKQKLQSQMGIVKENFQQLVRKESIRAAQQDNHSKQIKKRRLSTHNLGSLSPSRIRESIRYNPVSSEQTIAFIIERQRSTPLLQSSAIKDLNKARLNSDDLFIKMKQADKLIYPSISNSDPTYYSSLEAKVKQKIPSDIWLPGEPQVQELISNRNQSLINKQTFNLAMTDRPISEGFNPLQSSRKSKGAPQQYNFNQSKEMLYDSKRYHKSDYQSLQKWLQIGVEFINKQAKKQSKQERIDKDHLNQIYSVYMCAMKELIRLTYVESAQKGLILQKLIWSMVRLFTELIREQHKLNYNDFIEMGKQLKNERQMYQHRMQRLQKRVDELQNNYNKIIKEKAAISLTALSYKKVHESMNNQICELDSKIIQLKKQNNYLMTNLLKIIRDFQEKQIIKIQKTEDYNMHFYLNSKDKIQIIAKVPCSKHLQQYYQKQMQISINQIYQNEHPPAISQLDNALINYWNKKKDYLDLDGIFKEEFDRNIVDYGTQADGRGPQTYVDVALQHPTEGELSFEQFLKQQLTEEKQSWSKKQREYKQTQITLKDLYDQLKETITILTGQNTNLKNSIDHKDHQIHFQNRKISQLEEKIALFTKKIQLLEKEIEKLNLQQIKYKEEIELSIAKIGQEKKKYFYQKQNNNILASNNYTLRERHEQAKKKFQNLQERIKIIAPYLQEAMSLAETSENATLLALSSIVEKHLSQYVEKDAKVFLTH